MKFKYNLLVLLLALTSFSVSAYDEYEEHVEEPQIEYQGEAYEEDISYGSGDMSESVGATPEPLYEQDSYDPDYDE